MALQVLSADPSWDPGAAIPDEELPSVVAFVRREFEAMRRFRDRIGMRDRIASCLRLREGQYDPGQLTQIRQHGGSEVFARLTGGKCRGARAMMRDIYLSKERPWAIEPTPVPTLPVDLVANALAVVRGEAESAIAMGAQVEEEQVESRTAEVLGIARNAMRRKAAEEAEAASRYIDDLLREGGFYEALDEFLTDFVTFPFACMRGPVAEMVTDVTWAEGVAVRRRRPRLVWRRVDPMHILFSAGATRIEDAACIHRLRTTRAGLGATLGLPGYDEDAVRAALREYARSGHTEEWWDGGETADVQNRSSDRGEIDTLDVLEYSGPVMGSELQEMGVEVEDPDVDYLFSAWVLGRHLLKVQIDPDPRQRLPFYIASYEPVPGSLYGTALPEMIEDLQQVCNATLRALVNNESIASGPQVVVDLGCLIEPEDGEDGSDRLYPWKRWYVRRDPGDPNPTARPVEFFQPQSNAQDLITVYQTFANLADEISAVPRYLTGNERVGGAGRTASGLSMLMQNATRTMKAVAGNIDEHVLKPILQKTYDLVMLTGASEALKGDEQITVMGATQAEQKETDRMRVLEFLQMTGNPIDMGIMGPIGRAALLRRVADGVGLDGVKLVPTEAELVQRMATQAQAVSEQGAPPGAPQGAPPGNANPAPAPAQPGETPASGVEGMARNRALESAGARRFGG